LFTQFLVYIHYFISPIYSFLNVDTNVSLTFIIFPNLNYSIHKNNRYFYLFLSYQ